MQPQPSVFGRMLYWLRACFCACGSSSTPRPQPHSTCGSVYPSRNGSLCQGAPADKSPMPIASSMQQLQPDSSSTLGTSPQSPADFPTQPPLYLRVFTNVALRDADMLFPGSTAVFTVLDQLLIWVPVLIGLVSAIYKISTSVRIFATCIVLVNWKHLETNIQHGGCAVVDFQPVRRHDRLCDDDCLGTHAIVIRCTGSLCSAEKSS
jgi:Protein of unknown function (DUF3754)